MPMERTLILVKPDAMQRGLAGEIIARLERRGLRIAALKLMQVSRGLAERHYAEHAGKPFYEGLLDYITACPIAAAVFEGTNAVKAARQFLRHLHQLHAHDARPAPLQPGHALCRQSALHRVRLHQDQRAFHLGFGTLPKIVDSPQRHSGTEEVRGARDT